MQPLSGERGHVKLVQRMLGHASAAMTLNSLIEGSVKDHPK